MKIFQKAISKTLYLISLILISSILAISNAEAYTAQGDYQVVGSISTNVQYYQPGFASTASYTSPSVYWPTFDQETCRERQDFIVQVAPGGCEPAVVRSDLLEEQNVPVFCKLLLIQSNPLVDVSRIRSVSFLGSHPKGVAGISYFPSRYNLLNIRKNLADTPIDDNAGYFVVSLQQQASEKNMPDWIEGNLSAVIDYDVADVLGTGNTVFYTPELSNEDWLRDYKEYSFWNGKGYIKTESVESDRVSVSVYRDFDTKISTVTLKKGETSSVIYLPGFYCSAGLKVKVEDIQVPVKKALLQIDNQQTWVARGDRIIDDRCLVDNVETSASGGKVSISCPTGKFQLSLKPNKIRLSAGLNDKGLTESEYNIGDEIKQGIYLGYAGKWSKNEQSTNFAVFVSDPISKTKLEFEDKKVYSIVESIISTKATKDDTFDALAEKIKKAILDAYAPKLKAKNIDSKSFSVTILKEEQQETLQSYTIDKDNTIQQTSYVFKLSKMGIAENRIWGSTEDEKLAKEYYDSSIKSYTDLADFYPQEKMINEDYFETYAAEGLYKASSLAKDFSMFEDQEKFLRKLYRDYPNSAWAIKAQSDNEQLIRYNSNESRALVNLQDQGYFVSLLDFKEPQKEDINAVFMINGEEKILGLDEISYIGAIAGESIQVTKIERDYVELRYSKPQTTSSDGKTTIAPIDKTGITLDLDKKTQTDLSGNTIALKQINLKKQAKLTLTSDVKGPRALANFSFKIGIEKRGIKLSPEKTKEMMKNLESSIKQWEDINSKLAKVVKGLKGACFATSAALIVKNMFEGFGGKSMARNEVMTKSGGWNDYCEKEFSDGRVISVQRCLLDNNSDIEKSVEVQAKWIEDTNQKIKAAEANLVKTTDILDMEGQITDQKKLESNFRESIKSECYGWGSIDLPKRGNEVSSFNPGASGFCDWASFDSLKEVRTAYNTLHDPGANSVLQTMAKNKLAALADYAKNNHDDDVARNAAEANANQYNLGLRTLNPAGDQVAYGDVKMLTAGDKANPAYQNFKEGNYVVRAYIPASKTFGSTTYTANPDVAGEEVIVQVKKDEKGIYSTADTISLVDGKKIEKPASITANPTDAWSSVKDYMARAGIDRIKESTKAYENTMTNQDKLAVKYFDRAPYKGLPAEVPFDVNEGWYVEMEYVLSGFGKPYDESGRAVNYYICNVGSNGAIEFKRQADDICRYYNGVNDDLGFPGMDSSKSRTIVAKAKQAIIDAAKYYGKKEAYINGRKFHTGVSFAGTGGRCSDFMSPSDCNIMFNLCDPVICPASRCDLGGAFPVDNVIQTGVVGSLFLCLPNFKEGIYMPICLSGISAGIDGYVSILKAHASCLNESLATGKAVGICDEIRSIYTCEFFWKQLVPFVDVLGPKLVESFFSQGTRGGGEYLTVQSAWDNTQSAIDYFKNDYAVNSMKAFTMRSTEEAGTEVCKSFISARYPTNVNLLTEPDSPVQYHAWFDENTMTTATPYPTSHYKVYYHIYAGKDQGVYYTVYLKDLPEELTSSYIYTSQKLIVPTKSNFIPKGGYVDEARDFTAPSGYKQLCISINGQDDCGFGKVSTSFAVDYLSDKYAAEQSTEKITSSKECIAGTSSLYSFAQPNVQAGAEEAVQPELYNQGIVRVCSTYNPGKQVDANGEFDTTNSTYDRWKDVGYCDDLTLRCWLDTNSVKDVIQNKKIETGVLAEVDTISIGSTDALTFDNSRTIGSTAEEFISKLKDWNIEAKTKEVIGAKINPTVNQLNELASLGPSNAYRARGTLLLGNLYGEVARKIQPLPVPKPAAAAAPAASTATTTTTEKTKEQLKTLALKDPQNFYYRGYDPTINNYLFYTYDADKWWSTSSTSANIDFSKIKWVENNRGGFYSTSAGWKSASEGLNYLIGVYKENLFYIEKTGV